jgi:hypothetical protein
MDVSISIRNFRLTFGRAYTSNTRTNTKTTNKHKHHSKSLTMAPITAIQNKIKSAESSRKLSELLQRNQDDYHGFFNDKGVYCINVYPDLLYNTDVSQDFMFVPC